VLPAIAIYGANASGKSNVLHAARFFRQAVVDSHRIWPPEGGVPVDPYALGEPAGPSTFELDFLFEGVRHRYGFAASAVRIEAEWLHRWPEGRKQSLFERDGDAVTFGRNLHGANEASRSVMRANSLFLSAAAQNNHPVLLPLLTYLAGMQVRDLPGRSLDVHSAIVRSLASDQLDLFSDPTRADRDALLTLLRTADTGITNVRAEPTQVFSERLGRTRKEMQLLFEHRGADGNSAWLPLAAESSGTRTLLEIGALAFPVLRQGGVLWVDELEASLHPLLSFRILQLFLDPSTSPLHAQLLFTTHDTNLIGTIETTPIRRDQVWLTEKDAAGATTLYPLSDFKPRKEENLERGYLQGRYGAIPMLGPLRDVRS
jgi:hypothetical protein